MTTGPSDSAASADRTDRVEILERDFDHPDAIGLLRTFYDEQLERYGFADPIAVNPLDYAAPNGVFAVVYQRGAGVGCGGYRWFDHVTGTIEIKKTYVVPALRGREIGRGLLSWLEHHAVAKGARRAILETGARNAAALRLFTSVGYQPTEPYVHGRDPAINRAFVKSLTEPNEPLTRDLPRSIVR